MTEDDPLLRALAHPQAPPRRRSTRTTRGDRNSEASVMRECRRILAAHPDIAMYERRTVGLLRKGGRPIKVGEAGRADYWAVLNDGRHIEIEAKRRDGKGRLSPHQAAFKDHCAALGIPYAVVTNGDELRAFIESTT